MLASQAQPDSAVIPCRRRSEAGTVRYVTPDWHEWHPDPEHREEGGTPGIVESIRGAMAISIPRDIGYEANRRAIERRQHGGREQASAFRLRTGARAPWTAAHCEGTAHLLSAVPIRKRRVALRICGAPAKRPVRNSGSRGLLLRRTLWALPAGVDTRQHSEAVATEVQRGVWLSAARMGPVQSSLALHRRTRWITSSNAMTADCKMGVQGYCPPTLSTRNRACGGIEIHPTRHPPSWRPWPGSERDP